ncbi:hypothetical protein ACIBOV_25385 [Micromonospora chersina]|uniref:hypothetical protein n=1 Tax=Micromonospora chersina TaxID=47854 RepID=UPI0037ACDC20
MLLLQRQNCAWPSWSWVRWTDVIVGAPALRQRLEQLQLGARSEVMTFVKAPVAIISGAENTAEDAAVTRGVRYRVLLERRGWLAGEAAHR